LALTLNYSDSGLLTADQRLVAVDVEHPTLDLERWTTHYKPRTQHMVALLLNSTNPTNSKNPLRILRYRLSRITHHW